jgi:hypothetical protein
MTTRTRYIAEYLYPGSFMPEETSTDIPEPTLSAAIVYGPDEPGYFTKDGWYAVLIKTVTEKQYVSDDGDSRWLRDGKIEVEKIVVEAVLHVDDPAIAGPEFNTLRANIRSNSRDPYKNLAVRTRSGNWQILSDWDRVVSL